MEREMTCHQIMCAMTTKVNDMITEFKHRGHYIARIKEIVWPDLSKFTLHELEVIDIITDEALTQCGIDSDEEKLCQETAIFIRNLWWKMQPHFEGHYCHVDYGDE